MTYSSSSTSVSPLSEADLIVDTIAHLSMNYYEQGPELPLNGLAQASPSYVEQEKPPEQPGKWRQTASGLGRGGGSILWTCVAAEERQADMACFPIGSPIAHLHRDHDRAGWMARLWAVTAQRAC